MRIEQVDLFHIRIPLVSPFETSFGVTTERESIISRITADGVVGWGECVADQDPGYCYETVHTAWHIMRDFLIPRLFTAPFANPRQLPSLFTGVRGHQMAKATLESAIWDIASQQAGLSLSHYIGGVRDKVVVGVSVGIQPTTAQLVERVLAFRQVGYSRIKIKIKPGRDLDDARAVRAAIPGVPLMVDANSAYTLQDMDLIKQFDDLDLLMIEQPLSNDDIYEHSKLQKELKTPICLDESIHSTADTRFAIEMGSCRIINIKQGRVGGLTNAIAVHDVCQSNGIPVWCGGMLETGIGRALNVALATLPNFKLPGDLSASNRYYDPDIIDPAFDFNPDGTLTVPTDPGIGVNIVPERLRKVTLHHESYIPA